MADSPAFDPISLGVTGALGLFGARRAAKAQKEARQANERRYLAMLDTLRTTGEATKADIRAGAVGERAQAVQSAAGRGLYNSSVLDTLQSQANDREARSLANVDRNTALDSVGVMNDRTDAYPNTQATQGLLGMVGAQIPGLVGAAKGLFTPKAATPQAVQSGQAVSGALGGVAKSADAAAPYSQAMSAVPGLGGIDTARQVVGAGASMLKPVGQQAGKMWGQWRSKFGRQPTYASALF